MAERIERVAVTFAGEGAGIAELSWGQRELWGGMQRQKTWMPLRAIRPLPPGTTLDQIIGDLRYLVGRHQSLRTRLRFDPDGVKQVVASAGELTMEIVDAQPGADPAAVAQRVAQRLWDTDYDFVSEWPVRVAVIRHRGVLRQLVWVMCHLVTDAFGATVMLADLAKRPAGPPAGLPPLAQARWQRSPAGQRQCQAVLRHWERQLRTAPARRFPATASRPSPRFWHGSFTSPALHLAARAIAARAQVDDAPVLLAVFAVALARVTGIHPVVTRVVVSNRFRPHLAETVGPISQSGLLTIDVRDATVDEIVRRTERRTMATYKYAYYDPYQMDELVARVGRERGEEIDLACFFNDRRAAPAEDAVPTAEQLLAARPQTSFEWVDKQDERPYERLFVHLDDVPGTVSMSVFIDSHHVAPADVEACLRGMEQVAVTAAVGSEPH
jgi:hypothetical protein